MKKIFFLSIFLLCTTNIFCSDKNNDSHVQKVRRVLERRRSGEYITLVFSTQEKLAQFYNENPIGIEAYLAVMSGKIFTETQAQAIKNERKKQTRK